MQLKVQKMLNYAKKWHAHKKSIYHYRKTSSVNIMERLISLRATTSYVMYKFNVFWDNPFSPPLHYITQQRALTENRITQKFWVGVRFTSLFKDFIFFRLTAKSSLGLNSEGILLFMCLNGWWWKFYQREIR